MGTARHVSSLLQPLPPQARRATEHDRVRLGRRDRRRRRDAPRARGADRAERSPAVAAHEQLTAEGIRSRVVSMPSWKLFEKQTPEYRDSVLPPKVRARVSIEAGTSLGWREYVGFDGAVIARSDFGASAPIKDLYKQFGFTTENVVAQAKKLLKR
jgi:transketolase